MVRQGYFFSYLKIGTPQDLQSIAGYLFLPANEVFHLHILIK